MIFDPIEIRTMIHAVTRRTGTPLHDEDLEQDVALRAIEAFQRIDTVAYPRALLMKIVQDAISDYWRRRRSTEDLADVEQRFIAHTPAFEHDLDDDRRVTLLRRALEQLPATKRSVIELFYVQECSIPEIAKLHNKSISAVKMELARTREILRRNLCNSRP